MRRRVKTSTMAMPDKIKDCGWFGVAWAEYPDDEAIESIPHGDGVPFLLMSSSLRAIAFVFITQPRFFEVLADRSDTYPDLPCRPSLWQVRKRLRRGRSHLIA